MLPPCVPPQIGGHGQNTLDRQHTEIAITTNSILNMFYYITQLFVLKFFFTFLNIIGPPVLFRNSSSVEFTHQSLGKPQIQFTINCWLQFATSGTTGISFQIVHYMLAISQRTILFSLMLTMHCNNKETKMLVKT